MNRLLLSAQLSDRGALRTSPTGAQILECMLWHESEQAENGLSRKLSFFTLAKAVGPVAERLFHSPPSRRLALQGFVAPRQAARTRDAGLGLKPQPLIFHITDFELE